jgi:hypothetical protein
MGSADKFMKIRYILKSVWEIATKLEEAMIYWGKYKLLQITTSSVVMSHWLGACYYIHF